MFAITLATPGVDRHEHLFLAASCQSRIKPRIPLTERMNYPVHCRDVGLSAFTLNEARWQAAICGLIAKPLKGLRISLIVTGHFANNGGIVKFSARLCEISATRLLAPPPALALYRVWRQHLEIVVEPSVIYWPASIELRS